jgi:toxin ParE1/3/4
VTRLVFSDFAEVDLNNVLNYLEREAGPLTSARYAERFRASIVQLIEYPGSGAPRRSLGLTTRIMIVYPYVLIYDYDEFEKLVIVLRIIHGRRNITKRLIRQGPGSGS